MNQAWLGAVSAAAGGKLIAPRGQETYELLHRTIKVDMAYPVLTIPERKVNYRFMAAEALWILNADNTVEGVAPWNSRMRDFSDDGVTLAGAYGPRINSQIDYVVDLLRRDPDTRQATMSIWTPNPQPSKDIPCTVAMDFKIRGNLLYLQVFMRSSDVWLGLPYDVFSFTCVAQMVAYLVNLERVVPIMLGDLYLTAASSHLYARDREKALSCLNAPNAFLEGGRMPAGWTTPGGYAEFVDALYDIRAMKDSDKRWW